MSLEQPPNNQLDSPHNFLVKQSHDRHLDQTSPSFLIDTKVRSHTSSSGAKVSHPGYLLHDDLLVYINSRYIFVISVGPDIPYDLENVTVLGRPLPRWDRTFKVDIIFINEPFQIFFREFGFFWRHSDSSVDFFCFFFGKIMVNVRKFFGWRVKRAKAVL
jgi:hypothetical protein